MRRAGGSKLAQQTLPGMRRTIPEPTPTGEALKSKGTDRVLHRAPPGWRDDALRTIRAVARSCGRFTADDVHATAALLGLLPPHHSNAWGAVFRLALRQRYMRPTGDHVRSSRREARARSIPVYQSLLRDGEDWTQRR